MAVTCQPRAVKPLHPIPALWDNRPRKKQKQKQNDAAGFLSPVSKSKSSAPRSPACKRGLDVCGSTSTTINRSRKASSTMSNTATTIAELLSRPTVSPTHLGIILGTGKSCISRALISGAIPSFRVGRNRRINTSWLKKQLGLTEAA
jgi:hypothetical protein